MEQTVKHSAEAPPRRFAGEPLKIVLGKYVRALSGDGVRIFIQLFYFYLVANTLTISEFGLFATASSIGIVLSRMAGFGFLSPLYRIATVKPQLIGTYTAGYLAALGISLLLVALIGSGIYSVFFSSLVPLYVFALIVATEVLFWRGLEVVINVLKGLEKFGRSSIVIVFGYSMKALAALIFALGEDASLERWAVVYFATQAVMIVCAILFFYPKVRLRLRPRLYYRRLRDALSVSGAEVLFYLQMELDKIVVLAFGGEFAAGLYAIVMRLIDLTATPVRVFSTILTQRLMRRPDLLNTVKIRALFEAGVILVSTSGMLAMAVVLYIKPDLLGANVAQAAPYLFVLLMVPALRNLVEYHAELLYGRGQTVLRLINFALIGILKAALLVAILNSFNDPSQWFAWINLVFAALYAVSFLLTYSALRRQGHRV